MNEFMKRNLIRLIPPEDRITGAMGDALLRAANNDRHQAWTSRRSCERLVSLGLATFVESVYKARRLRYQIKLTLAGVDRAKEL